MSVTDINISAELTFITIVNKPREVGLKKSIVLSTRIESLEFESSHWLNQS